jgi:hypothetical protein
MKIDRLRYRFSWLHRERERESQFVPSIVLPDFKNSLDLCADLDTILKRLIVRELTARGIAVSESDITPAYLAEYRDQNIYPHMDIDFTSRYGGINPLSNCYLTKSEVDLQRAEAEKFLSGFA